ncbi:MAG: hypothetical protein HWD92_09395 [Flavobacteriia bacterium]|nr:hypothetical protein [Flavobacteriia bacterium]
MGNVYSLFVVFGLAILTSCAPSPEKLLNIEGTWNGSEYRYEPEPSSTAPSVNSLASNVDRHRKSTLVFRADSSCTYIIEDGAYFLEAIYTLEKSQLELRLAESNVSMEFELKEVNDSSLHLIQHHVYDKGRTSISGVTHLYFTKE